MEGSWPIAEAADVPVGVFRGLSVAASIHSATVFGLAGVRGLRARVGPGASTATVLGSGGNGEFGGRIMEGQELVDVVQVALAADRTEARVATLLAEEGVDVGDVGQLGVGEAEQLPAACEVGPAPAAGE